MTTQVTPDNPQPDRRAALLSIAAGLLSGLPAPTCIRFDDENRSVTVDFDAAAAIDAWADTLHLGTYRATQPYPLLSDYETWTASALSTGDRWHGWQVFSHSREPITEAHIAGWVESGDAARAAAFAAKQAEAQAGVSA